MKSEIL